jgi:hypothetical protein
MESMKNSDAGVPDTFVRINVSICRVADLADDNVGISPVHRDDLKKELDLMLDLVRYRRGIATDWIDIGFD